MQTTPTKVSTEPRAARPLEVTVLVARTPSGAARRKALLSPWRATVTAREWRDRGWTVDVVRLVAELAP